MGCGNAGSGGGGGLIFLPDEDRSIYNASLYLHIHIFLRLYLFT
jgi:hypothetical protein